jgi:acyl carrier protein
MENKCVDVLCEIYSRFVPAGQKCNITANTKIFGCDTVLDSLGLVSFLVDVEQYFNDKCGTNIVMVDEKSMSQKHSPFRTIKTLADYVVKLLSDRGIDAV